ncbi:response regulator receiver protein [Pedosphaera parvula Ellin514]|uniref:Response regulator receiver protein n=2 Tax=Pedosphaera TaxID=1032526 RepID=B9XM96_PEDPL|nr:response regulator receiver protein [Pedosphaera parvula Ellin514]
MLAFPLSVFANSDSQRPFPTLFSVIHHLFSRLYNSFTILPRHTKFLYIQLFNSLSMKDVTSIIITYPDTQSSALPATPFTPFPLTLGHPVASPPTPTILTIENSDEDFDLLDRALKSAGLSARLYRVLNISSAQNYLLGTGPFRDQIVFPKPYLVITNSRLAAFSAQQLITWIRHQPTLETLPIIVQSASLTSEQRGELYQHGANFCLPKTNDARQLAHQLLTIHKVWHQLGLVRLQSEC